MEAPASISIKNPSTIQLLDKIRVALGESSYTRTIHVLADREVVRMADLASISANPPGNAPFIKSVADGGESMPTD